MKYCPQCGSPLKENQHFCNRCGCDIQNFKYGYTQENNYFPQEPKRKRRIWPFIVIAIFVIAVIGSSCFAYYHFFLKGNEQAQSKPTTTQHVAKEEEKQGEHKISNDPKKAEKQRAEEEKEEKTDKENAPQPPKIDVLSNEFHKDFMESDRRNEYKGIRIGMTKEEVERRLGKSSTKFEYSDFYAFKYGDLAILYSDFDKGKVVSFAVVPENVSVEEFIQHHPKYTARYKDKLIYNNDKTNNYEIDVIIKDNKIKEIMNIDDMKIKY